MGKLSLKVTVLLTMVVLVVTSCLLTASVATLRYSQSLEQALVLHTRSLAHSLSGPITEMVLVNDLVGVQRLLDSQFQRDMAQGYALLELNGRVLAHTLEAGVPEALLPAPPQAPPAESESAHSFVPPTRGGGEGMGVRKVSLGPEQCYLEVAWPLLDGHAGILRMGFSQRGVEARIATLWGETAALTLLILLLAVAGGILWLRRLGRPLAALVRGIESIGSGNLTVRVTVAGQGEVATLARAFNTMSEKLEGSMLSMEAQAAALQRSHRQLRLCNDIVTVFAALDEVEAMARVLPGHLRDIVPGPLSLLVLEHDRRSLIVADGQVCRTLYGQSEWHEALHLLEGREAAFSTTGLRAPLVSSAVAASPCQSILCIVHEHCLCGALFVGLPTPQAMEEADRAALELMLRQVGGSMGRALRHGAEARGTRVHAGQWDDFCGILGSSPRMGEIFRRIRDVAASDATVLITGESGTGKELAARALHSLSLRAKRPFVVINCAAYPESLLESELFGYEKGAFTGAVRQKPGRFEQADGGTVFLDEIGEISPLAQVRLLRVLQARQFERVGGEETLTVDVRVLAATNRDLAAEVRAGRFREDLYYRLDVISLAMPPLRERRGDVPQLARHYLEQLSARDGRPPRILSPSALRVLMAYDWPGNVRELENMLEQCAALSRREAITAADLPERLRDGPVSRAAGGASAALTLEEQEATVIREALAGCAWNRKHAAARLGIGRTTLYAKMKRYGIHPPADADTHA